MRICLCHPRFVPLIYLPIFLTSKTIALITVTQQGLTQRYLLLYSPYVEQELKATPKT